MRSHLIRFVRFTLVGGIATGVQYVLLIVLVRAASMAPTVASSVGFMISACVNYFLNYHYTFGSSRSHAITAAKFGLLVATGLAINGEIMHLLVSADWEYLVAQVCATGVVLFWNFIGNSLWTFGAQEQRSRTT